MISQRILVLLVPGCATLGMPLLFCEPASAPESQSEPHHGLGVTETCIWRTLSIVGAWQAVPAAGTPASVLPKAPQT